MGDDPACGLTLIAFIGSVFSPYYAAARRRGQTPAERHCAVNIVLHRGDRQRWAMTERGHRALARNDARLGIGPSSVEWDGRCLRYRLDEFTFPWPGRIRGEVRFTPAADGAGVHALDAAARHHWLPLCPRGRVEVDLDSPRWTWQGSGYFDHNRGSEPLERAFHSWSWSRWTGRDRTLLHYDVQRRSGPALSLRLAQRAGQEVQVLPPRAQLPLPRSGWRIERAAPADEGTRPRVVRTLLDSPFYARSLLESTLDGERLAGVHESLSLDRFGSRWVQALRPFRRPRRAARRG